MSYGNKTKTSDTYPLRIDPIILESDGMIGMTFCPGIKYPDGLTEYWHQDLEKDLNTIAQWDAKALITLIEDHEFVELHVLQLPAITRKLGIEWFHLPIRDASTPEDTFEQQWAEVGKIVHHLLDTGNKIVLHVRHLVPGDTSRRVRTAPSYPPA